MSRTSLQRWAFAALPAVGLLELAAHAVQTRSVTPGTDWDAARVYVAAQARPDDLVAFAPRWADPIGREHFGPALATVEREARPDETRFPRALEVSIRGAHLPALAGWRRAGEQRFGSVTVTTWENPTPAHVIDDLVSLVGPPHLRVTRGDADCNFIHGSAQSGNLGFGPTVPADRFVCPSGGFVGVSVVADLDYVPHRCVFAPPPGSAPLRLHFDGVHFGHVLHGHHALYVEAERDRRGAPVTLRFESGGSTLGTVVHRDGEGWKPFELDTSPLAGQTGELSVEIASPGGDRRLYCFEADTR
ncbi:MAG TPA: hypothetical protein VHS09_09045 [Polyangiaceae bacterium]|nr:hypothetical protein [Polyangiaceae bacterium]